ncbi:MAG TPA: sugar ABC transporter ATP-binding protein [Bryobacteraceae bacterium]|nr:sugar ABC transporter ATP-binding protein [Bryobacteraceae bacterium]
MYNVRILRANGISKSFAGVRALKHVSFDVKAGEVHALAGENGAGKSTLIKVLTGAVIADEGTVELDGQAVEHNSPAHARALGIIAIYQQPALFPDLSVAENIALATEEPRMWRRIDWRARWERARELLGTIGASIDPHARADTLSMPEQQLVEIARALGAKAKYLILDEPTASLTNREVEKLFDVIRRMRAQNVGLIYISHRLEELQQIADRVTVLRDGSAIETREMAETGREKLIQLMVGREISQVFPKADATMGEVALELRGVCGVNLALRAGEILGLAGMVGSGRTELAEAIFGLRPATAGEILVRGRPARIQDPRDAVEHGIAYVPEDRRRHGVILDLPIDANLTLATLRQISSNGLLNRAKERDVARQYVEQLGIKTSSPEALAGTLSGGNQQKVALGRWLAAKPSVLILDEPTQGVDVGAKFEIHRLMCDLAGRGLAILMISSELPEILGMSDRIAVMRNGRVAGVLDRTSATQERILSLALESAA